MFQEYLRVMYHLAKNPEGLTAGELSKLIGTKSKGQVSRLLNDMKCGRYVAEETKPHGRTGKRVFSMTELAVGDFRSLANLALENAVQS